MTTVVARIHEVLRGHSARAQLHAVDAEGNVFKLEVPSRVAESLTPEHVIVLTWTTHVIPLAPGAAATGADPSGTIGATTVTSDSAPSLESPLAGPSAGARQLAGLMGLKLE